MAKAKLREWMPEAERVPKAQPSPKLKDREKLLVGKRVTVCFLEGTSLTGTLASVQKYTFVLEQNMRVKASSSTRSME